MADPHATLAAGHQLGIYPLPYVPGMPLTGFDPNLAHEYRDAVREIGSLPKSEPAASPERQSPWRSRPVSPKEYDRDSRLDMLIGRLRAMRASSPDEFRQAFGNPELARVPPTSVKSVSPLAQGMPLREGLDWAGSLSSSAVNAARMAGGVPGADEDFEKSANVLLMRIPQALSQSEMYPERSQVQRERDSIPFHDPRLVFGQSPEGIVPDRDRNDGLTFASQGLREAGAPDHWGTDLAGMVLDGLVDFNPVGVDAAVSLGRAFRNPVSRVPNAMRAGMSAGTDLALPALFTGVNMYGRQDPLPR